MVDYNKALLDKWYTQDQIDAMRKAAASWWSQQDIVNAGKTPTTTPSQTGSEVQNTVNKPEDKNLRYAANNTKATTTPTTTEVVPDNQQTNNTYNEQVAKKRWTLTSAEKRAALRSNLWLKDYLDSKWISTEPWVTWSPIQETPSTPTTPTTKKTTTPTTPKQQQWDYQDNSQARMDQILYNLNGYRQSNPELFKDASAFYTFFIDWKGRSQDQIDYLWDYYNNVKKYSKYDNWSSSALWDWLADWSIPKDYLDYLKSIDPAKYQEVLSYKQDSEDRIKYENYLDELSSMAWYESEKSEVPEASDPITYAKKMWYFVDENWDWIDDNLYVKPTDEERQDVDRINEINARRMEIKNMQKNLLDDLVEQYPWVPKATLMWIVQDRTKDISREYDDLWVELTQLQWTVDYLQNERDMQASARQDTINNLSKAYWMYYSYSPEWIAELAQSQYAATNITLDQADDWNETQKQMALQNVLDWYYEKYWDIIQRSEQQVINDVIAYAKKNWIWLAQALQENFIQPLKSKEWFDIISSWWTVGWSANKWSTFTTKDAKWNDITLQINQSTWEIRNLDGTTYDGVIKTKTVWWATFTPVSYAKMYEVWSALEEKYPNWSSYKNWWCWELMNLYLQEIGSDIRFGDDVSTKTKWITEDDPNATPAIWSIVVWDYSSNPNMSKVARDSWHVARVTKTYADGSFDVWEQNWDWKHQVWTRHITSRDYIAWFIDPASTSWTSSSEDDYTYEVQALAWIPTQLRNTNVEKQWYLDILDKMKNDWLNAYDAAMALIWFKITNNSKEAQTVKNKILTAVQSAWNSDMFDSASMQSMSQAINRWDYADALKTMENKVSNYVYSKRLTDFTPTRVSEAASTLDTLDDLDILGWKEWTLQKALKEWKLWNATSTEVDAMIWDLSYKLRMLWYNQEELNKILPDMSDKKTNFQQKLENIKTILVNWSNSWRRQYQLPETTYNVLLWLDDISSLYLPSTSSQLYEIALRKAKKS